MDSTSSQGALALSPTSQGQARERIDPEHTSESLEGSQGTTVGNFVGSVKYIQCIQQAGWIGMVESAEWVGWVMRVGGVGWVKFEAPSWIRFVDSVGWVGWIKSVGMVVWESAGWVKAHTPGDPFYGM